MPCSGGNIGFCDPYAIAARGFGGVKCSIYFIKQFFYRPNSPIVAQEHTQAHANL